MIANQGYFLLHLIWQCLVTFFCVKEAIWQLVKCAEDMAEF